LVASPRLAQLLIYWLNSLTDVPEALLVSDASDLADGSVISAVVRAIARRYEQVWGADAQGSPPSDMATALEWLRVNVAPSHLPLELQSSLAAEMLEAGDSLTLEHLLDTLRAQWLISGGEETAAVASPDVQHGLSASPDLVRFAGLHTLSTPSPTHTLPGQHASPPTGRETSRRSSAGRAGLDRPVFEEEEQSPHVRFSSSTKLSKSAVKSLATTAPRHPRLHDEPDSLGVTHRHPRVNAPPLPRSKRPLPSQPWNASVTVQSAHRPRSVVHARQDPPVEASAELVSRLSTIVDRRAHSQTQAPSQPSSSPVRASPPAAPVTSEEKEEEHLTASLSLAALHLWMERLGVWPRGHPAWKVPARGGVGDGPFARSQAWRRERRAVSALANCLRDGVLLARLVAACEARVGSARPLSLRPPLSVSTEKQLLLAQGVDLWSSKGGGAAEGVPVTRPCALTLGGAEDPEDKQLRSGGKRRADRLDTALQVLRERPTMNQRRTHSLEQLRAGNASVWAQLLTDMAHAYGQDADVEEYVLRLTGRSPPPSVPSTPSGSRAPSPARTPPRAPSPLTTKRQRRSHLQPIMSRIDALAEASFGGVSGLPREQAPPDREAVRAECLRVWAVLSWALGGEKSHEEHLLKAFPRDGPRPPALPSAPYDPDCRRLPHLLERCGGAGSDLLSDPLFNGAAVALLVRLAAGPVGASLPRVHLTACKSLGHARANFLDASQSWTVFLSHLGAHVAEVSSVADARATAQSRRHASGPHSERTSAHAAQLAPWLFSSSVASTLDLTAADYTAVQALFRSTSPRAQLWTDYRTRVCLAEAQWVKDRPLFWAALKAESPELRLCGSLCEEALSGDEECAWRALSAVARALRPRVTRLLQAAATPVLDTLVPHSAAPPMSLSDLEALSRGAVQPWEVAAVTSLASVAWTASLASLDEPSRWARVITWMADEGVSGAFNRLSRARLPDPRLMHAAVATGGCTHTLMRSTREWKVPSPVVRATAEAAESLLTGAVLVGLLPSVAGALKASKAQRSHIAFCLSASFVGGRSPMRSGPVDALSGAGFSNAARGVRHRDSVEAARKAAEARLANWRCVMNSLRTLPGTDLSSLTDANAATLACAGVSEEIMLSWAASHPLWRQLTRSQPPTAEALERSFLDAAVGLDSTEHEGQVVFPGERGPGLALLSILEGLFHAIDEGRAHGTHAGKASVTSESAPPRSLPPSIVFSPDRMSVRSMDQRTDTLEPSVAQQSSVAAVSPGRPPLRSARLRQDDLYPHPVSPRRVVIRPPSEHSATEASVSTQQPWGDLYPLREQRLSASLLDDGPPRVPRHSSLAPPRPDEGDLSVLRPEPAASAAAAPASDRRTDKSPAALVLRWFQALNVKLQQPWALRSSQVLELTDGVLLCELVERLEGEAGRMRGGIAGVDRAPKTAAARLQNIRRALATLRENSHMAVTHLWSDLALRDGRTDVWIALLLDMRKAYALQTKSIVALSKKQQKPPAEEPVLGDLSHDQIA
jgi:hypothetical protein